jgi:membrane protein YdbS with pleckstrin-like domain
MAVPSKHSDKLIFVIKPSQWINFGWLLIAVLFAFIIKLWLNISLGWAAIPFTIWLWKCVVTSCWQFQCHEKTITERKGVFSMTKIEIHYFRIKSIRIDKPFLFRLVGLSNIDLITSDPLIPVLRLYAISNSESMRKYIKEMTDYWRKNSGVKESDIHIL